MRNLHIMVYLIIFLFTQCNKDKEALHNNEKIDIQTKETQPKQAKISDTIGIIETQIEQKTNSFLHDRKYFSLDTDTDEVKAWIAKRIENAKNGKAEIVQLAIGTLEDGCGEGCSLYYMDTPDIIPHPLLINPIFQTSSKSAVSQYPECYVTGYFTGTITQKINKNLAKSYDLPNFKVLLIEKNPKNTKLMQPMVVSEQLYDDVQRLSNIEMIPFQIIFDGKKYMQIYPDLPKAQKALIHKDTGIKVFFKGQDLAPDVTPQSYMEDYVIDSQFIGNGKYKLSPDENWLYIEEYIPQDSVYIVLKKWFRKDDTTFTIRMDVNKDQLEQAYLILEDFSPQVIPEFY